MNPYVYSRPIASFLWKLICMWTDSRQAALQSTPKPAAAGEEKHSFLPAAFSYESASPAARSKSSLLAVIFTLPLIFHSVFV
ncbi:hypothetical protein VN24_08515 [Paenibacillus beijingensis]|uniref:Uncharacterized protein n=1 Tax=Paenibacillus beijingensis TaxID=1126833 RepID=A0A0D5NI30_9BACL|nr:hypothetical protein VN24_08515 [Paenibacillus beijingensis]